jgi:SAM-dependent methyltransferase
MSRADIWSSGDAYEPYVGRWSRRVAPGFLAWLAPSNGWRWLDVGCGTGALSQTILERAAPMELTGVDASEGFVAYARAHTSDPRASFVVGDAQQLSFADGVYDAAVSGLALNIVPQPGRALAEMARVTHPGGLVAVYVWDYTDQMQLMRHFWEAAVALDPAAKAASEGIRFAMCRPEPLAALFRDAGLRDVSVSAIDIPTVFRDFDDYWLPFLGGQGPAPTYATSLDEERRVALRERIRSSLPIAPDGSISLIARAWAIRGSR